MLIDEIERIRGQAPGVSLRYILDNVGNPEYPELTKLDGTARKPARTAVARAMKAAGYVRRTQKSTYWFAPGRETE